jgi:hypothetical protein
MAVVSANLCCVSGTLFESILRADGPQNGFHTSVGLTSSIDPGPMAGYGATLSLPRVPAKVPSPSHLRTLLIVYCNRRNATHFWVRLSGGFAGAGPIHTVSAGSIAAIPAAKIVNTRSRRFLPCSAGAVGRGSIEGRGSADTDRRGGSWNGIPSPRRGGGATYRAFAGAFGSGESGEADKAIAARYLAYIRRGKRSPAVACGAPLSAT